MREKFTVLALVGLSFALLAGPVLAAGSGRDAVLAAKHGPKRKPHVISFTGTIDGQPTEEIDVLVQMTNKPFVVKRGQTVTVVTTSRTVYYEWSGKSRTPSNFSDLGDGDRVSINALVTTTSTATTITARRIEENKPRYP